MLNWEFKIISSYMQMFILRRSKRHRFLLKQCSEIRGQSHMSRCRKCFKGLIHSTQCEFPHCIKDFRSRKSFTTIQSRKIKINLWFSQSLNCWNYDWNFYSKKIIVLAFHLDVRTQSFSLLQSYHYLFFFLTI